LSQKAEDLPPLVIVLTGPSGAGKDAVIDRAIERGYPIVRPATMTTRAPRSGEQEGIHHYFSADRDDFMAHVAAGDLLEYAEVYGNLYGVPRQSVRDALSTGNHVLVRVDVQGAEALRDVLSGALFVAVEPVSLDALRTHLEARDTEDPEQIERRLAIAQAEIERARRFCTPLVNVEGDLDATVDRLMELVATEQCRPGRQPQTV